MKNVIKLSPKQEKAVLFKDGAILIKAAAGSGKTRVLTERIKSLLPQTKRKILAITFTNKAGEEMRERLLDIPDIEKRLFIGTFHGFCQKIIENHISLIGLSKMPHLFEDESDRLKLIEQAIELTPSYYEKYKECRTSKDKRDFCYRALGFISKIKRELCTQEETDKIFSDENIALFYSSYQDLLQSQNAIDFDDLILLAYQIFSEFPKISALYRRTYEYICIDEAQDLNNAQYQFLRTLTNSSHNNVMFVGDPNQSIFAFNGSSSKFMGEEYFVKDFSPLVIELNENYRSSIKIVDAAKKIMPNANHITNAVIKGDFHIHKAKDEIEEATWVIQKIKELISLKFHKDIEGKISYDKIAILARTKYVFKYLEETLSDNKIPFYYKITAGPIKFETKLMQIFDLALRVKINPSARLHCNKLIKLLDVDYSSDLGILIKASSGQNKKILELVKGLDEEGNNFSATLKKVKKWLKDQELDDDNEKKMLADEIDEILIHWVNYAKKNEKKSLHGFKRAMALGQTNPLTKQEGITLSTVHTMKGQQNEIIVVIGMDDGTFPYYKATRAGGIEMIQEKNNAYVAFTRAKRFLYVTWPQTRVMPWGDVKRRQKSRFLNPFE